MGIKACQIPSKDADGARWASVSFSDQLDTSETLSGTPTVTEVGTSDLTISNVGYNISPLEINGVLTPTAESLRFYVLGGTAGTLYDLEAIAYSNSSPAQKIVAHLQLRIT